MRDPIQTVAIVGVGLIGGSFGLALRAAGFGGRIVGVSSARSIAAALDRGAIDEGLELERACAAADLIYLAGPISGILGVLPEVARHRKPESLVTDVGSTKRAIVARAAESMPAGAFLGGHPMAGKEVRGAEAAEAALFQGRPYIVTPETTGHVEHSIRREFREWILRIGAHELVLSPAEHDRIVAMTSHLPQLCSTALAAALHNNGTSTSVRQASGPGLQDMIRLAASSWDIWKDIIDTNGDQIAAALSAYRSEMREIEEQLRSKRLEDTFQRASRFARLLRDEDPLEK